MLSTVYVDTKEIKHLSLVKLSHTHKIEIICVPNMDINSYSISVPQRFKSIPGQWAVPTLSHERHRLPQVLIGSDCPSLMPVDVYHEGKLAETKHARLKRSVLTGKLLLHGF